MAIPNALKKIKVRKCCIFLLLRSLNELQALSSGIDIYGAGCRIESSELDYVLFNSSGDNDLSIELSEL